MGRLWSVQHPYALKKMREGEFGWNDHSISLTSVSVALSLFLACKALKNLDFNWLNSDYNSHLTRSFSFRVPISSSIPEEKGGLTKVEQDSESGSAMDDETEPLSGKPFFHMLLQKSHIVGRLTIPVKISRMLPSDAVPVVLTHGSRMWDMTYNGNHPTHKRLDSRWRTFVADNKLQVGDVCLFELTESGSTIKFKVQILRGNFPFELLLRQDGSKDRPVIID